MLQLNRKFQQNVLMLPYIKIDTYLSVYVKFIFSFYQAIACSFILINFVFSILTIVYFGLSYEINYIIRFFFI